VAPGHAWCFGQKRDDRLAADIKEAAVERQPFAMRLPVQYAPVENRIGKRLGQTRVRNGLALLLVLELREACKLAPSSLTHLRGKFLVEIAEKEKRARRRPFLAHEE